MAKGRSSSQGRSKRDGTRYVFWLNMLIVFVLIVLLVLGQWDFLLAAVLAALVLNGVLSR